MCCIKLHYVLRNWIKIGLLSWHKKKCKYMCILHTYLWYSSTLKVGVLVVGVGGELSLLTPWFKEVSCTLSRFPCIALLWFANFSLFIGVPRITRSYDEARSNYFSIFIFNPFLKRITRRSPILEDNFLYQYMDKYKY